EVRVSGSFLYTPEQVGWRNLHLSGETLALDAERGRVGMQSGRLEVPLIDLKGKGAPLGRILQSFGIGASVDEAGMRLRLGGSLVRPELSDGELTLSGFEMA